MERFALISFCHLYHKELFYHFKQYIIALEHALSDPYLKQTLALNQNDRIEILHGLLTKIN